MFLLNPLAIYFFISLATASALANTAWLRILNVEKLSNNLLQESIPLRYTPRHFIRHPDHPLFYVISTEANVLAPSTRQRLLADPSLVNGDAAVLPPEEFGYPRGKGHWASCIQVIDPVTSKSVLESLEIEENEAAVSMCVASFTSQDDETFLVVGTAKDMVVYPRRSFTCGFIHIYRFHDNGRSLEFVHKTKVEAPPLAVLAFQGRLLVGVGADLRIYDLGMRQLLRKAQYLSAVPNTIVDLQTQGSRIIAADSSQSVTYVVYKYQDNILIPFADDAIARHTTATTMLDYETTAGGDKFGNLWAVRCPAKASEEADEEGGGAHLVHEKGYLQGTGNRLELMVHFYTQDIPTSVQKTSLVPGGRDVLLWGGLMGTLGILVPFVSREDVDFFQSLEGHLRAEDPPLAGRDHLIYRSYYVPVKGVIDGDLCERYARLGRDVKERIAGEVDRSVREVERKIAVSFSVLRVVGRGFLDVLLTAIIRICGRGSRTKPG